VEARQIVQESVKVTSQIHECLVDIGEALKKDKRVVLGISTRSLVQAIPALQVWAMMHGRDYVSPRDVKGLAVPLFSHRLELIPGAKTPDVVMTACLTPVVEALTRKSLAA